MIPEVKRKATEEWSNDTTLGRYCTSPEVTMRYAHATAVEMIACADHAALDQLRQLTWQLVAVSFKYIDKYGRSIRVTRAENEKDAPPPDEKANQVDRLAQLIRDKAADYNSGGVRTLSYFVYGERTLLSDIHKKAQRLISVYKPSGKPFEDAPTNVFDLAGYCLFLLAYLRVFPNCLNRASYSLGTLCYLERNGDILVVTKRIARDGDFETVNLPGGKVESGETPSSCAIRELREETGLTALLVHLKGVVTVAGAQLYGLRQGPWCLFLYEVETWSGNLISENGSTPAWEDKVRVPSLLPNQADRHIFEFLVRPHEFEGRVDYRSEPPLINFVEYP